jgi:23S rRNA (uracil1939-C5)-methyltransferase
MTSSESILIQVQGMAHGGDSIARLPDGRTVFTPFVLPDEVVEIQVVEDKGRFARAIPLQIIEASPFRVDPACPHFLECGGCQYQHIDYQKQVEYKGNILVDQLQRLGSFADPPDAGRYPSNQAFNYRNHIQYQLSNGGRPGFVRHNQQGIMEIVECHLPEPVLNDLRDQLDLENLSGIKRLGMRLGMDEDMQIVLEGEDPLPPSTLIEDLPVSLVYRNPYQEIVLAGSDKLWMQVMDKRFVVSAGSFFQVNTSLAESLVTCLLQAIKRYAPHEDIRLLIDVYCGGGLFSSFLADRVGRLIGIESSASACSDFEYNLDAYEHVELFEAPAEVVLPNLDEAPDIVLLDPPRAGVDRHALDGLKSLSPGLIVYVSCDPATLARDLKRLSRDGYILQEVSMFDMFPQTSHIESISILTRG